MYELSGYEAFAMSEHELGRQVTVTVVDEVAHDSGICDERFHALGCA